MCAAAEQNMRSHDDPVGERPNVLVVDDNEAVARALSRILSSAGYDPAVFYSGTSALAHVANQTPPAAALVDIHLPDISGLVLTHKLREQLGPEVPIIILSGDTSMETLNTLPHVGATYFFSKPVNGSYLLEKLQGWIEERNRHDNKEEQNAT